MENPEYRWKPAIGYAEAQPHEEEGRNDYQGASLLRWWHSLSCREQEPAEVAEMTTRLGRVGHGIAHSPRSTSNSLIGPSGKS